jgi:hypothetical protein
MKYIMSWFVWQIRFLKTSNILKGKFFVAIILFVCHSSTDNVNEYLRIAASISPSDRAQAHRVKSSFERRNQKSAAVVGQLKKKLDAYQQRLEDLNKSSVITGASGVPGVGVNQSAALDLLRGLRYTLSVVY